MNWPNYNMTVLPGPLISIIIPVYNRPLEFAVALASAEAQDYLAKEIIVVDDGSEPAITVSNETIKLIRQKNQGAPVARNVGASYAAGEYVIFWDADMTAPKNLISQLFFALQNNPGASYAYCDHWFGEKKMAAQIFDAKKLKERNYIATPALIRKVDFPGFDPSLKRFQDWDLWLTMLEQKKVGVYVPNLAYTLKPGGTMSSWLPKYAYMVPFKWLPGFKEKVKRYEAARQVIVEKHSL